MDENLDISFIHSGERAKFKGDDTLIIIDENTNKFMVFKRIKYALRRESDSNVIVGIGE